MHDAGYRKCVTFSKKNIFAWDLFSPPGAPETKLYFLLALGWLSSWASSLNLCAYGPLVNSGIMILRIPEEVEIIRKIGTRISWLRNDTFQWVLDDSIIFHLMWDVGFKLLAIFCHLFCHFFVIFTQSAWFKARIVSAWQEKSTKDTHPTTDDHLVHAEALQIIAKLTAKALWNMKKVMMTDGGPLPSDNLK